MQFKKGPSDRRVPDFEQLETAPKMDTTSQSSESQRSPFAFSRGGGSQADTPREPQREATPQPAVTPTIESVVDATSTFEGHFHAEQDLRIQGTVSGEVTCRGRLTIEQDASARARIDVSEAEIFGSVEGDITCSGRLRLAGSAVVTGTIKAGSLVVEEGASINGSVEANFAGEGVVSSPARRRSSGNTNRRADDESDADDKDADESSRKASRGRELPSFALVSSDDPQSGASRSS